MLPGGYSSVLHAKDREEFRDEIVRFAQQLGFDTVAAVTVLEHGLAGTEFTKWMCRLLFIRRATRRTFTPSRQISSQAMARITAVISTHHRNLPARNFLQRVKSVSFRWDTCSATGNVQRPTPRSSPCSNGTGRTRHIVW